MILFHEDWQRYKSAIPNLETTNKSFLRIAGVFREMGVVNHAFPLALLDRSLVGVDPFDENLTPETIARICVEAKNNPWFFLRECMMVPATSGGDPVQFGAHRGNLALWWLFFNHITLILIQIRQTGKSVGADSLVTYLMNIRCNNTLINLLTKDDKLRYENIKRIKKMEDVLPYYMKLRTKNDINNTEMLAISANGNAFRGHVPQKNVNDALKVGRGMTSPIFIIDEAPFQPNIGISFPAALTGGLAARDEAARKGEPWGTIFTTTAGKKDDPDGKVIYEMLEESAIWSERYYDAKNQKELEEMIMRHSRKKKLRVNVTLNHTQLGRTDEWLMKAINSAERITPEEADRDFFNVWTAGTLTSPLPIPVLEKITKSMKPHLFDSISSTGDSTYITRWFIPENTIANRMASGKFIMGVDTSDGQGGDDISLYLSDVSNGETVAAGNFNETNLISFAEFIADWIIKYVNITAIIERKSSGVAIIDYLLRILPAKGIDPFKRLFNRVVNDMEEEPDRFKQIDMPLGRRDPRVYIDFKKYFGFATSATGMASRSDLYSETLQAAAKRVGEFVYDSTTASQITSLITVNGRIDHPKGGHDDMVIAWLLNYWLTSKGKNLGYYGIDYRLIHSKLKPLNEEAGGLDPYTAHEQDMIRGEMDEVYNRLQNERDEFICSNLEHRLKYLNNQLIRKENEIFSIDELINNIRDSKRKKKYSAPENANGYAYSRPASVQSGYSREPLGFNQRRSYY